MGQPVESYYAYSPSHVLPIVFAVLIGASFVLHIWQNFRYRYWRVTYLMPWGGLLLGLGWIMREISSCHKGSLGLYSAQYVLILCAAPIYSAAEYNVLGRLMHYVPMFAPLHPGKLVYFFLYLGAIVEGISAAGAAQLSVSKDNDELIRNAGRLMIAGLMMQSVVEVLFISLVGLINYRCMKSKMLTKNIRTVCIMLYGTSMLILFRCVYRIMEKFAILSVLESGGCNEFCESLLRHEWHLYGFEGAPMVLYTYWLNIIHPGRFLPRTSLTFLDYEGVERQGPGWQDKRSQWATFIDPFDLDGLMKGRPAAEKFWESPTEWPAVKEGLNQSIEERMETGKGSQPSQRA